MKKPNTLTIIDFQNRVRFFGENILVCRMNGNWTKPDGTKIMNENDIVEAYGYSIPIPLKDYAKWFGSDLYIPQDQFSSVIINLNLRGFDFKIQRAIKKIENGMREDIWDMIYGYPLVDIPDEEKPSH